MNSRRQGSDPARAVRKGAEPFSRAEPIFKVVSKAATDLNDVLNAVALRSALMRGRQENSHDETDTWRLAGLLDRASELVRELQAYVRDLEAHAADPAAPPLKDQSGH